ncbi:hypothetical protein [Streptomyces sp. NPDC060035]|uniref:hypothetical protein n=1 Tax=Streptomyces sp. NPDC060035 TaxID=3347044 RepID=UPI0036B737B1
MVTADRCSVLRQVQDGAADDPVVGDRNAGHRTEQVTDMLRREGLPVAVAGIVLGTAIAAAPPSPG